MTASSCAVLLTPTAPLILVLLPCPTLPIYKSCITLTNPIAALGSNWLPPNQAWAHGRAKDPAVGDYGAICACLWSTCMQSHL